jgi:transcriptional regulator with XRE-family HTH domain
MLSTQEILERLRALRKEMLLNQERLAGELGIDRTTYIRKEKGKIPITTDEWIKIAEVMGKDAAYFFHTNNDNRANNKAHNKEELLLKLFRSLNPEEKKDFVASIRLMLKGIQRKKVRDTLQTLIDA